MTHMNDNPTLTFASPDRWETWLEKNHTKSSGIWLKIAKKDSGIASVSHQEALDIAIAFGWIDALRRGHDSDYFLQRFTPRNAKSKWSKINCAKAVALIEQKRMRPAGLKEVEAAKSDGRWEAAYHGQRTSTVPDDLAKALKKNKKAAAFFEILDSANRYAVLYRLQTTNKPELRAKKLEKLVKMLEAGEMFHALRKKMPAKKTPKS